MEVKPDFLNELKALDERLDIVDNPNYPQLANIKLAGVDVCPIPRQMIKDDVDPNYAIIATNGWRMRHKSRPEAIAQVKDVLKSLETPEGNDLFFNR